MEAVLSAKTSALCFNKDDFMVNDFSVDKFVSNYRKYVSLETLLADLGVYHRILCSAMIELINKDYADFLNLSSNLVGLDKSIKILCLPLEKLEAGINENGVNLHETMMHASTLLYKYSTAHKRRVLAHHALCVLEGLEKLVNLNTVPFADEKIPLDVLERIALDFNIVKFHIKKSACLESIENKQGVVEEIADNLKRHLENLFLESLSSNDTKCLLRVLRIYTVISMEAELEKFFAEVIVKPYMECHITEENIHKYGLSYVYDKILYFITTSTAVLDSTRETKKKGYTDTVPGFDFLVNSVFPEIVYCFDFITPVHIYAHGNPEKFHENYTSTMLFLHKFEHCCGDQNSVQRLRNHESYERFISKWNLDVYFQIIISEIAGKFEKCVLEGFAYSKDVELEKRNDSYLLHTCKTLSECVNRCYDEKVFLKPLGHCFFRLNLKLISRFNKSACSYLKSDNEEFINPVDAAVIIRDVEMLITEFTKLFEEKIIHNVPRNVVEVAFKESMKFLEGIIPLANSVMIKALVKQCCVHLKLISDIPRLYRKTNREVPCKPSSYVALVFNNLTEFISETNSILPVKSKNFCLTQVINGIIIQCVVMIRDVLTAIEKMEHSLKILKRARDKNPIGSSGITDDDKIRLQLIIDIAAVEEKARELELDVDNLKSFKELKDLMNSTEKILPQNF